MNMQTIDRLNEFVQHLSEREGWGYASAFATYGRDQRWTVAAHVNYKRHATVSPNLDTAVAEITDEISRAYPSRDELALLLGVTS